MSHNTKVALVVGLLLVAAAGAYYYWQSVNSVNSP
jgi:hypothetical protein